MSMLVVGLSHRTASVPVLESVTVAPGELAGVLASLVRSPQVAEAMVLSTCNRVEIYAEVDRFHGGVHDVSELLARRAGTDVVSLDPHLYVHYEDAAAGHLFAVAAGLDSMVVGEAQILGQLRTAYAAAQQAGTAGRQLHDLTQQALRVGKRVHSETGIDAAGGSLVAVGLGEAQRELGDLAGRSALVCGAGSMAALIGLDPSVIDEITEETGVEIANYNAPGQTTVSGRTSAVEAAMTLAKERGARRALMLQVSGAFHSSLMEPVVEEMTPLLAQTAIAFSPIPLVTNVDAKPIQHPDDIRAELLAQICASVRWIDVITTISNAGVTTFYEVGPGKVLSGLISRIVKGADTVVADALLKKP